MSRQSWQETENAPFQYGYGRFVAPGDANTAVCVPPGGDRGEHVEPARVSRSRMVRLEFPNWRCRAIVSPRSPSNCEGADLIRSSPIKNPRGKLPEELTPWRGNSCCRPSWQRGCRSPGADRREGPSRQPAHDRAGSYAAGDGAV
jgi:hypothetical protein